MSVIGLEPTGMQQPAPSARTIAARKADLDGAVVGLVSNGVGRSADLLRAIHDRLAKRYRLVGSFLVGKPNRSVPPTPADWRRLTSEASVAITAFGGCGSCSTRSLRDALELEWAGRPSAAIVHHQQLTGVTTMAAMSGFADYPYIAVDDRYASLATWSSTEIEAIADQVIGRVCELLTGS